MLYLLDQTSATLHTRLGAFDRRLGGLVAAKVAPSYSSIGSPGRRAGWIRLARGDFAGDR
jgi:hypothetical protein